MKTTRYLGAAALITALAWSAPAHATTYNEVIDGATCQGYPPNNSTLAYQHWVYGFNNVAYCHLRMSTDWPLANLSYVLYEGTLSGGSLTARLCVHSGDLSVTCGPAATDGATNYLVDWVAPPSPLPAYASGAFVQFSFPSGKVTTITQLYPVWYK